MEAWGGSSKNAIIFTEPDFDHLHALAPYQPLNMKVREGGREGGREGEGREGEGGREKGGRRGRERGGREREGGRRGREGGRERGGEGGREGEGREGGEERERLVLCIIQAFYFPIDPRLNFFVANKLLKELAVRTTSDPYCNVLT